MRAVQRGELESGGSWVQGSMVAQSGVVNVTGALEERPTDAHYLYTWGSEFQWLKC
jgi:hypothetical protein